MAQKQHSESRASDTAGSQTPHGIGQNVIDSKHEAHRVYRVIGTDEPPIEITAEGIWRGGQMHMAWHVWRDQFRGMCSQVLEWSKQHEKTLHLTLVCVRSDKVVFFFVPRSETFDFDLAKAQSELAIELNAKGGIGYVETRQVPLWEIERFVGDDALRVWPRD